MPQTDTANVIPELAGGWNDGLACFIFRFLKRPQAALEAYRKSPEVAEWANSKAAKAAFALSNHDLVALAECDKPGWKKEKRADQSVLCVPYAKGKNELHGWLIN